MGASLAIFGSSWEIAKLAYGWEMVDEDIYL